jgi:hypothetical protein
MDYLQYYDEEYSLFQQAILNLDSYLLYISDIQNSLKNSLLIFSQNTKISKEEYNLLIDSIINFLNLSKNLFDNSNSIIRTFKKFSGDVYER